LPAANSYRSAACAVLIGIEIAILSALVLATRSANYRDVFVAGNVYFTDADCYSRMTRVRICEKNPGSIVRHHDFENYPAGTTPHTAAPLDYFILALSVLLKPVTMQAPDLAGALISPIFGLLGAWFLWWWSRQMGFRYRWVMLVLYAISPILVHGTELGRPDHQSLLMLLVTVAISVEWMLRTEESTKWSIVSGIAWGLALWVSAYESLFLLLLMLSLGVARDRQLLFKKDRRAGWIAFATVIAVALAIEQRLPSLPASPSDDIFRNWSRAIGELSPVSPLNKIWLGWAGYLIVVAPILIWLALRRKKAGAFRSQPNRRDQTLPFFILVLLVATFLLTIWQARWAYFFMSIFVLALPSLLEPIRSRAAVWVAFTLSVFPILRDWDESLWPREAEYARRIEQRNESVQLRDLATNLQSSEVRPFLAPWWLSPAIAYWSGQPGVAGSSHESLDGIADSARFFLAENWQKGREILENRKVSWVFAADADRVCPNSAALLGLAVPAFPLCRSIDRTPAQASPFLVLSAQNATGKLFRFVNNR
jgi:hypothetical protein